jgi:FMN reductase
MLISSKPQSLCCPKSTDKFKERINFVSDILTIAGSPSHTSRSSAVLALVRNFLYDYGLSTDALSVRDLDATELFSANANGATVRDGFARVHQARAIVIATPIYKAAYSGVLKAFLDLLPQDALADKLVFPIATGGSPAHLLAIDYALKPVLSALGAHHILNGLYIQDAQIQYTNGELTELDVAIEKRLHAMLMKLVNQLAPTTAGFVSFNSVALVR